MKSTVLVANVSLIAGAFAITFGVFLALDFYLSYWNQYCDALVCHSPAPFLFLAFPIALTGLALVVYSFFISRHHFQPVD